MTGRQKLKAKIGILAAAAISLSYIGFSPIIASIAQAFSGEDISLVQMILTIPNLMFIVFSPLAGTLMLHFHKKNLMLISVILYIAGGLFPFFFHSSIWYLLFGSVLIGSGSGLMMPTINGMICDYFDLDERGTLMGLNATCVAGGALVFIFVSGFLSQFGWHFSYLVFALLIPVLLVEIICLPQGIIPDQQPDGTRGGMELTPVVLFIFIAGFFYFITQNAFNTNSSLIVQEYGITDENAPSLLTMGNTLGGLCGGMLFGIILKKLKDHVTALSVGMAALGFLVAGALHSMLPVTLGSVMVGFGFAVSSAGGTFMLSKYTRPENNAFTLAMYNGFVNLGAALSPYFINNLAGVFGPTIAVKYLLSAGILAVVSTGYFFGMKQLGKES